MPKENLSQRVLLEILTKEIEVLKKSTEVVKRSVPAVEEHLKEIVKTELKVDPSAVEDLLKGKQIIKQWQQIAFVVVSAVAIVSIAFAIIFHSQLQQTETIPVNVDWKEEAYHWYHIADSLGYEAPK